jgi:hypothetical protein
VNDDLKKDFKGSGRGLVKELCRHLPGANKKMATAVRTVVSSEIPLIQFYLGMWSPYSAET